MKFKFFVPVLFSIVVGLFLGKVFFDNYDNSSYVFSQKEKVYMLQVGVYSSLDKMKSSFKDYEKYLYISGDDGYHLYVGVTKDKKIAMRIKEFFEKKGYSIYVKDCIIDSSSFLSIISEYDKIINITSTNSIDDIEKIVIANYKEMVLDDET